MKLSDGLTDKPGVQMADDRDTRVKLIIDRVKARDPEGVVERWRINRYDKMVAEADEIFQEFEDYLDNLGVPDEEKHKFLDEIPELQKLLTDINDGSFFYGFCITDIKKNKQDIKKDIKKSVRETGAQEAKKERAGMEVHVQQAKPYGPETKVGGAYTIKGSKPFKTPYG